MRPPVKQPATHRRTKRSVVAAALASTVFINDGGADTIIVEDGGVTETHFITSPVVQETHFVTTPGVQETVIIPSNYAVVEYDYVWSWQYYAAATCFLTGLVVIACVVASKTVVRIRQPTRTVIVRRTNA